MGGGGGGCGGSCSNDIPKTAKEVMNHVRSNLHNTGAPPPRAEAKAPTPTSAAPAKKAPPPPRVGTPASPPPPEDEQKGSTNPAGRSSPRPPPGEPPAGPTRATPPGLNYLCIHLIRAPGVWTTRRCVMCCVFTCCRKKQNFPLDFTR